MMLAAAVLTPVVQIISDAYTRHADAAEQG